MKKVFAGVIVGLALGAVSAVSALDMSVGGGASFTGNFGGGFSTPEVKYQNIVLIKELETKMPWMGGVVSGFFDLTYAEISIGITGGSGTLSQEIPILNLTTGQVSYVPNDASFGVVAFDISLLGKYPIALSDAVSLAPLVGIDYQSWLAGGVAIQNIDGSVIEEPGDNSRLWVKFGLGLDYNLNEKVFLRIPVLYGIGLANKVEEDAGKVFEQSLEPLKVLGVDFGDSKVLPSNGLTLGVSVGFRL
jgi:hypothetical protein